MADKTWPCHVQESCSWESVTSHFNLSCFLNWIFLDHITVMTLHCCRLFTPSFRRNVPQWELHHCWSSVSHKSSPSWLSGKVSERSMLICCFWKLLCRNGGINWVIGKMVSRNSDIVQTRGQDYKVIFGFWCLQPSTDQFSMDLKLKQKKPSFFLYL